MPIIPYKYRQSVVRAGMVGFGTYLLYKAITPSEETVQKFYQDPEEKALGVRSRSKMARVVELSQQGYSYHTITRIIAEEKKKAYLELFEREKQGRLKALEAQVAAEKTNSSNIFSGVSLEKSIEDSTRAIKGTT